jgi:hypothetical protein
VLYFLREYIFLCSFLVFLGFVGGFLIIPFNSFIRLRRLILISPLAGIIILSLGIAFIYTITNSSFHNSFIFTSIFCVFTTILLLVEKFKYLNIKKFLYSINFIELGIVLVILSLIGLVLYLTNAASLHFKSPSLQFLFGSDHLGYSHLADWLIQHDVSHRPGLNSNHPYESWPVYSFQEDPRFGSFYFLAVISFVRHLSGAFSYDFSLAVILSAAYLAISSLFSRSLKTFILLLIGLMTSYWLINAHTGYLGKTLGQPAFFLILGIFFVIAKNIDRVTPIMITALAFLTCGTAILHSASGTALLLAESIGFFCLISCFGKLSFYQKENQLAIFILLIGICIMCTGTLAKPIPIGIAHLNANLFNLLIHSFSYGSLLVNIQDNPTNNYLYYLITFAILIYFIFLAIEIKDFFSLSLFIGPQLVILYFIFFGEHWIAYELLATIYVFFLIGSIYLLDSLQIQTEAISKPRFTRFIVIFFTTIVIVMHFPFFWDDIKIATDLTTYSSRIVKKSDLDAISSVIGDRPVRIELSDVNDALPILVELGREHLNLQWTKESWQAILSYRYWPTPEYTALPRYILQSPDANLLYKACIIKLVTKKYKLLECKMV